MSHPYLSGTTPVFIRFESFCKAPRKLEVSIDNFQRCKLSKLRIRNDLRICQKPKMASTILKTIVENLPTMPWPAPLFPLPAAQVLLPGQLNNDSWAQGLGINKKEEFGKSWLQYVPVIIPSLRCQVKHMKMNKLDLNMLWHVLATFWLGHTPQSIEK